MNRFSRLIVLLRRIGMGFTLWRNLGQTTVSAISVAERPLLRNVTD
jgi:hypothetical protein